MTAVTIGGFIMGTTLGWTAPAGPMMENNQYGFQITTENVSWIASVMPLGAMLGCPVMAGLVNKSGRKHLMIWLTIPTLVGWAMIIWAKSVNTNTFFLPILIVAVDVDNNSLRWYGFVLADF